MNLYFRFFAILIKNLFHSETARIHEETSLKMRVLPNDLDLNMHMNNGRFLTVMDIGRTDFIMKMGLLKTMLKEKWGGVATAVNVVFLKPLNLFDKYELRTKLLSWDEDWFYLEQNFFRGEVFVASAIVKGAFLKGKKRLAPQLALQRVKGAPERAPEFPRYLADLLEGEKSFIKNIKLKKKKPRGGPV
ncbi:MAG: acyl-CoA thioesterase [Bacteriovoracaceae bacterium]